MTILASSFDPIMLERLRISIWLSSRLKLDNLKIIGCDVKYDGEITDENAKMIDNRFIREINKKDDYLISHKKAIVLIKHSERYIGALYDPLKHEWELYNLTED